MQSTNFNKRLNQAITASKLHDAMDRTLAEMVRGRRPRVYVENIFREMLLEAEHNSNASAPPAQPVQQSQGQTQKSTSGGRRTFQQYVDYVKNNYKRKLEELFTQDIKTVQNSTKYNQPQKNNLIKVMAACYQGLIGALKNWKPREYDATRDKDIAPYDPNSAGLGTVYSQAAAKQPAQ